jgi:hypothetical protein
LALIQADKPYAVICSCAALPAFALLLLLYLSFVFALAERKNERQKKEKYRCLVRAIGKANAPPIGIITHADLLYRM